MFAGLSADHIGTKAHAAWHRTYTRGIAKTFQP